MHRQNILQKLANFTPYDEREAQSLQATIDFIKNNSDCFKRENLAGHLTGSAWIVNYERTHALMIHHKKLDMWIQLGGHCDGNNNVWEVANEEAWEESGLKSITPISQDLFDLDYHPIPAHKEVAEHIHYDPRFLFEADMNEVIHISEREANAVSWLTFEEIEKRCKGNTVVRMVAKIRKSGKIAV